MISVFRRNVQVDSPQDALEVLRVALIDAGWEVVSGDLSNLPIVFGSATVVGGVRVYVRFFIPDASTLRQWGDIGGGGTQMSTPRDLNVTTGSRLWLASDNEAFCVYVKPPSSGGIAIHNGRLNRLVEIDGFAWQVGVLTKELGDFWQTAQGYNSESKWVTVPYDIAERSCVGNIFNFTEDSPITAAGRPFLGPYFRAGNTSETRFRGTVKFAVTGLAGAEPGSEWQGEGKIYVATGQSGFQVG